jgi:hypothetical protein
MGFHRDAGFAALSTGAATQVAALAWQVHDAAMRDDVLSGAHDLLHCQQGVLTRGQALDAGLTDKAIAVTVLDLIAVSPSLDEAVSLILRASAGRRTTPERILTALAHRAKMPRRTALLLALGAAKDGAQSLLEFRYITGSSARMGCQQATGSTTCAGAGRTSTRTSATTTTPSWSSSMGARRTRSGSAGRTSGGTTPARQPAT